MGKEKQEITWREEETNLEEILVLGNWGLSLKVLKQSERNLVRSNLVPSFKVMKQTSQWIATALGLPWEVAGDPMGLPREMGC